VPAPGRDRAAAVEVAWWIPHGDKAAQAKHLHCAALRIVDYQHASARPHPNGQRRERAGLVNLVNLADVSFSAYARQVRDPGLPYRRRVSALRSCVQLYRPIGFRATLSFLEELAGPFQRDEAALLRALDALATSRAARRAQVRCYALARTAAKRRGQRRPRPGDLNPHQRPGYWYGAPRQAAVHALRFWQRERLPALLTTDEPIAVRIGQCVRACVAAGGTLTPQHRQVLAAAIETLHERLQPTLWPDDQPAYFRVRDLLQLARYIEVAADAG
jgi:hypothetical protein